MNESVSKPTPAAAPASVAAPRATPRAAGDPVMHGGADCVWGVAPTVSYGTITDEEIEQTMIDEPHENQKGQVIGHVEYDGNAKLTLSIVALATEVPPAKGVVLTYNAKNYLVKTAVRTAQAKGKVKYRVTAELWDNETLSTGA